MMVHITLATAVLCLFTGLLATAVVIQAARAYKYKYLVLFAIATSVKFFYLLVALFNMYIIHQFQNEILFTLIWVSVVDQVLISVVLYFRLRAFEDLTSQRRLPSRIALLLLSMAHLLLSNKLYTLSSISPDYVARMGLYFGLMLTIVFMMRMLAAEPILTASVRASDQRKKPLWLLTAFFTGFAIVFFLWGLTTLFIDSMEIEYMFVFYLIYSIESLAISLFARKMVVALNGRKTMVPNDAGLDTSTLQQFRITPREEEVITLVHQGMSNKEISSELNISVYTVKDHIRRIYEKSGAENRVQLVNIFRGDNGI